VGWGRGGMGGVWGGMWYEGYGPGSGRPLGGLWEGHLACIWLYLAVFGPFGLYLAVFGLFGLIWPNTGPGPLPAPLYTGPGTEVNPRAGGLI